jgi:hypothetical protein
MSASADKRIAAIREKVREERALSSELNKQIGADLKKQMKPASYYLDDVEGVSLCRKCSGIRRVWKANGQDGSATY